MAKSLLKDKKAGTTTGAVPAKAKTTTPLETVPEKPAFHIEIREVLHLEEKGIDAIAFLGALLKSELLNGDQMVSLKPNTSYATYRNIARYVINVKSNLGRTAKIS